MLLFRHRLCVNAGPQILPHSAVDSTTEYEYPPLKSQSEIDGVSPGDVMSGSVPAVYLVRTVESTHIAIVGSECLICIHRGNKCGSIETRLANLMSPLRAERLDNGERRLSSTNLSGLDALASDKMPVAVCVFTPQDVV